jgi:hypothetical protein
MADPPPAPRSLARRLQPFVMLLGLAGIAVAVRQAADDVDGRVLPGPGAFALALAISIVSLLAAAHSWASILERRRDRSTVLGAFYASQLTKYLPAGGVVQAAGQVTLTAGEGIPLRVTAAALPVFAMSSVVSGLTLGSLLAFNDDVPVWARVLSAAGPLSLVLARRPVLLRAYDAAQRVVRRLPDRDVVPPQSAIDRGLAWATVNLVTFAAAFAILVRDLDGDASVARVAVAAVVAWVVGFLVVPLPSGLGVREAILVAAIPSVETAVLLACSLAHRLAVLGAEVAMVLLNRTKRTLAKRAHSDHSG